MVGRGGSRAGGYPTRPQTSHYPADRPPFGFPAALRREPDPGGMLGPMSEDERLAAANEAHAGLKEVALRLRQALPAKSPALKAAHKVELQRLTLEDP